MNVRYKQKAVIEFLHREGIKQAEIVERLKMCIKTKQYLNLQFVDGWTELTLNELKAAVKSWLRNQPQEFYR